MARIKASRGQIRGSRLQTQADRLYV